MNKDHAENTLLNGEWGMAIDGQDRGFNYGHGLFETMRFWHGRVPLWSFHSQRLVNDAPRLGVPCNQRLLEQYFQQFLSEGKFSHSDDGIIKITLTAGVGDRGYRTVNSRPNYLLQWFPYTPNSYRDIPLTVRTCDYRLPANPALAGIKHLNRLDQVLARQEWGDEFDDGFLLDGDNNVIEAISSNLFCLYGGIWLTPSLTQNGVAGVMRAFLMQHIFPSLNLLVEERQVPEAEIKKMDAIFLCNAVQGVRAVASLDHRYQWESHQYVDTIQQRLYEAMPCFY